MGSAEQLLDRYNMLGAVKVSHGDMLRQLFTLSTESILWVAPFFVVINVDNALTEFPSVSVWRWHKNGRPVLTPWPPRSP